MIYPFYVFQNNVENHVFWVAKSASLKGCVGQGDSISEAISELEINEDEWISAAKETGIPIPAKPLEPSAEYSGKLTVRIAPRVHKDAATIAKIEKVSLTQYISDAIVNWNAHNAVI